MFRLLFIFIGNVLLLPVNLVLLIPRLLYKIIINNKAGLWITIGGKKKIIEVNGRVNIK
jgi:hypothetical protein